MFNRFKRSLSADFLEIIKDSKKIVDETGFDKIDIIHVLLTVLRDKNNSITHALISKNIEITAIVNILSDLIKQEKQ